ncbi:hypothetical protein ERK17_06025 [Lactobacillus kullabergensis]|nr:hypothetical protein [Lactobacillus kullabergensis]
MKAVNKIIKQQKIMWATLLILFLVCVICRTLPKISDVNWQTILSLFSLMLVTQYLINIKALDYLSQKIINLAHTHRQVTQLLVLLAGFLAMFLTNDVAILSLIPLFLVIHKQVHGPFTFPLALITIAANLGSALAPFGNPQNLYLYNHYQLSTANFFKISLPLFLISFVLILLTTFVIPATPLPVLKQTDYEVKPISLIIAFALLIVTLAGVLHFVPLIYTTIAVVAVILITNRFVFTQIDYGTLITFIGFFLIVGILGRQKFIITLVTQLLKQSFFITYLTGILLSQVISNVPATFLITRFSTDITAIFLGVNVGGLGTPLASFANLLALKQAHVHSRQVLLGFLTINFIFLIVLATIIFLLLPQLIKLSSF